MRLLPCLPGLLLITAAAAAQPANYNAGPGPGYDPSAQPMPGPDDVGQPQGDPGYGPGPQGPGGQEAGPGGGMPQQNAARRPHGAFKQRFEAANLTHDGRLTLDQARQGHIAMVVRNFDQIDADHKGYVTIQDVHAWHRARRQAQQQGSSPAQPSPMR